MRKVATRKIMAILDAEEYTDTKELKKKRLADLNNLETSRYKGFLKKTLLLLSQLKRGGNGIYPIMANMIQGLDNNKNEIEVIMYTINPIYSRFNFIYNDRRYSDMEIKEGEEGKKKTVLRMKFSSPEPVFFTDRLEDGGRGHMERTFVAGQQLDLALSEIKEVLELQTLNDAKKKLIEIKNLKKPIIWEEITIIYNGESIQVKQSDALLGEYNLSDIGIPKTMKNRQEGVRRFFLSLFFLKDTRKVEDILSTRNQANQKNKSNLSKILRDAFDTNKDPIFADQKTSTYRPLFKTTLGKELKINDRLSGSKFDDEEYKESY